ncbi:Filamentation protein [Rutstroemia sp. NJR-2017a WRK4]|nr:Filamentation protein [Rutstroemia sp. NJR-2017a WRK4]
MSREQTKAANYIQLLDAARCEGNWDAVPELVRKVRKHAPTRTCLTLTAETEHAITQYSSKARPASRPSPEDPASSSLAHYIPPLLEAIANERQYIEDDFQAQVCLGWIHWYCGEHALVASRLPESIEGEFAQLDGTNKESAEWTKVCALKASYIKGDAQRKMGKVAEALETFESALPILSSISTSALQLNKKELMSWSELLLTGFCMTSSYALRTKTTPMRETDTLSAFRAYAKFWDSASVWSGGRVLNAGVSRREVWKEYYITLSEILQQHLPFPTTALTTAYAEASTRLQQRAELKRVETNYETFLLSEVDFPKAEEPSEEVEAFVQLAMQNWRIFCGNTWQESDLGEGGAEAVSRVHLAVAEFDLAFKAFDTYLEIVKRGKARVEKTGEAEYGLDSDELVLKTTSECIKALCRYGSLRAAEKAKDLGHFLEEWLNKHQPHTQLDGNSSSLENGNSETTSTFISPTVLAMTWRSIGTGYAQWARLTFDASSRSDMQSRAISCFRKALLPEYKSTSNAETLFALGTILAERRELSTAIQIVKVGLTPQQTNSNFGSGSEAYVNKYSRERSLIPLWHLMALLLSARQEFPSALRSCEGVFDQFGDPRNLFGDSDFNGTYRSDHLSASEKSSDGNHGLVDEMDDFEKENLLEVKMTQLSLTEVLEGSEVAVNSSDELLSLYARLFGDPSKEMTAAVVQAPTLVPPKSSAGTLRSMKGSIFSRSLNKSMRRDLGPTPENSTPPRPETAQATVNRAPTIHVTQDSGTGDRHHHHHHEKLHKKIGLLTHGRGTNKDAMVDQSQQNQSTTENHPGVSDGEKSSAPSQAQESWNEQGPKVLPPDSQQMDQQEPTLKLGHNSVASFQDNRLPFGPYPSSSSPITRFSKDSERRRRMALLVKVWLLIAGFYRRATMYEDAKGAVEEAHKLVTTLETDIYNDPTGLASYENAGWGSKKSVAELWGDVFAERGHLAVDQSTPYVALDNYEAALNHFADHPAAVVGLSEILLDIYTEELPPLPNLPPLVLSPTSAVNPSASTLHTAPLTTQPQELSSSSSTSGPLGLPSRTPTLREARSPQSQTETAQLDRLAARDRAYGLLSALTKLGSGWNYSEAWFALARAYELSGQKDKAREVLWWCVELEEGRALRGWEASNAGGYVL